MVHVTGAPTTPWQKSFTHFHLASGRLSPLCLEHTRISGSASNPTPVAVHAF